MKIWKTIQNQTEEQQNVLPTILITTVGNKSKHSLDRFKKYFKNFLTSCPCEHAFPILLRHTQAAGFIEMCRAQQCVPWRWIFEIVMMAADELHTFVSYRWINRELVHSNSWRFAWVFEALSVRPSSYAITTSSSPPDFSPSALLAMRAKKPNFKRL